MNMMVPNFESGNLCNNGSDLSNGQLLRDIEEISKALVVESITQKSSLISSSSLRPNSVKKSHFRDSISKSKLGLDGDDVLLRGEHKASSIWDWKPLKVLSHIRHKKFACYFFCHVHCVDNLAPDFDGISMSVYWKRKDNVLTTRPSRVLDGMVEFEETLVSKCTVYGAKSGHGKFVKYEPKLFLLCVSIVGAEGIDVGKHWVDLTRLLPITHDELEQDKCSGKWSTSFKLGGTAKGAQLHVSFGFLVTRDSLAEFGGNLKLPPELGSEQSGLSRTSFVADDAMGNGSANLRRVESVPSSLTNASYHSYQCLDVKLNCKHISDFANSIDTLYGKLDERGVEDPTKYDLVFEHLESLKLAPGTLSESVIGCSLAEHDYGIASVMEKEVEPVFAPEDSIKMDAPSTENLHASTVEVIDVSEIFKGEGISSDEETKAYEDDSSGFVTNDVLINKQNYQCVDELKSKGADTDLCKLFIPEAAEFDTSMGLVSDEFNAKHKGTKLMKSLRLDDVAKSVAEDFFILLQEKSTASTRSSYSNQESPRERLLRQFEEDMVASGTFNLGVDEQEDESGSEYAAPSMSSSDCTFESVDLSPVIDKARNQSINQLSRSKMQAKSLECLETQSLMQRWGLNEEAFLSSPHYSKGGFGSPIFVPSAPDEPVGLPPLGEGLGSLLHMKDGGFLRSMSPSLFRNAKNCGNLIMQASKLVVLPAELGYDIMEMFQDMALLGSARFSSKLQKLMPLEELSGKTMEQLAWEASYEAEAPNRPSSPVHKTGFKLEIQGSKDVQGYNYAGSGPTVSDVASEYVSAKDLPSLALDSLEVLAIEGLKVQSVMSDQDAPSSIRVKPATEATSQHNIHECSDFLGAKGTANYIDGLLDLCISLEEWLQLDAGLFGYDNHVSDCTMRLLRAHHAKFIGEDYPCNEFGKAGVFGDSIAVALLIQLRDPLRNYEPVGAPILGVLQVERVFRPASLTSEASSSALEDEIDGDVESQMDSLHGFPAFRLTEVHVAGLNSESSESWASKRQQQSGSRWLLAGGLTNDCHFSKSRSLVRLSSRVLRKPWTRSILWSISLPILGAKADADFSTFNSLTRNPNIIFPY